MKRGGRYGCKRRRVWGRGVRKLEKLPGASNAIMEPNKARGRVMRQYVRGEGFKPEGFGVFHGMKEKVRRIKG